MKRILVMSLILSILSEFLTGCGRSGVSGNISASGTIEATDVILAAQVPGKIVKMNYEEGSTVKKGDTLAEIDHSMLLEQVKEAEALLEIARQQYKLALAGARSEDIKVAQEAVSQALISFNLAEKNYKRMEGLYKEKSASQAQYDDAKARYDIALAQLKTSQETLKKVEKISRPEEIKQASARVQQAEAALEIARINLDNSYIISPIDGSVTEKLLEPGDFAAVGTPVYTVSDLRKMKMTVYVTEVELAKIRLGDHADVVLDGMPHHIFPGRVTYISQTAEFTPKDVQTKEDRVKLVFGVQIEMENSMNYLKAGLPAEAVIYSR
ncbi:MAG: HlyD family secretion protein [Candidatus Kryptoniota bacterium]